MYITGNDTAIDSCIRKNFFSGTRHTDVKAELYSQENENKLLQTFGSENEIIDMSISRGIQSDEDFIGCVISKEYTIRILDIDKKYDFAGKRLKPYIGIGNGENGTYYVPFPAGDVYEADYDRVKKIWTVICYDDIQKLNNIQLNEVDFSSIGSEGSVEGVMTLSEYVSAVCRTAGLAFNGGEFFNCDMTVFTGDGYAAEDDSGNHIYKPNFSGNEYLREVISGAAQAALSNAVIDRSGCLAFVPVAVDFDESNGYTFTPDDYFSFSSDEEFGPVNTIVLSRQDLGDDIYYPDDDTAGSVYISDGVTAAEHIAAYGRRSLRMYDNPFLDRSTGESLNDTRTEYISAIFDMMKGRLYTAYNLEYRGTPAVDEGDRIRITDINGRMIETLYFSDTLKYDGGLTGSSEGKIISQTAVEYEQAGSVSEKLQNTQIKVDKSEALISAIVSSETDPEGGTSLELSQEMAELIARCIELSSLEKIVLKAPLIELVSSSSEKSQIDLEEVRQTSENALSQLVIEYEVDIVYSEDENGTSISRTYTADKDRYVGIILVESISEEVLEASEYQWYQIAVQEDGTKEGNVWMNKPSTGYEPGDLWINDNTLYECISSGSSVEDDFEPYDTGRSALKEIRDDIRGLKINDIGNISSELEQIKQITNHLAFESGSLHMYEDSSKTGDEMSLSKNELKFMNGGNMKACFGSNGIKAPDANFYNLIMSERQESGEYEGKWNWVVRSNGNLSFKWYKGSTYQGSED